MDIHSRRRDAVLVERSLLVRSGLVLPLEAGSESIVFASPDLQHHSTNDPMPITIDEGYKPGYIGRIAQLHAAYYSASNGFGVEFEAKVARELGDFCISYTAGRDGLWIAADPEVQGSIAIDGSNADKDGAHLRWFVTSNVLRGQGLGRRLLGQALEFADACGYRRTYLWTFDGLTAARHLYEAHGFCLVLERRGSQWGTAVLEQRFERKPPSPSND